MLCYRLMPRKGLFANNNNRVEKSFSIIYCVLCANFQLFKHFVSPDFCGPCICYNYHGQRVAYKPTLCVLIKFKEGDEFLSVFDSIVNILQNKKGVIDLVSKLLITYGFDVNLHVYVSWTEQFAFVNTNELISPFPVILVKMESSLFATVKHKI